MTLKTISGKDNPICLQNQGLGTCSNKLFRGPIPAIVISTPPAPAVQSRPHRIFFICRMKVSG